MNHITDFHTAVNAINARTIENLMDIDWGAVTNGYSIDGIARFLIAIQDNTLGEPIKRAIEQHYFLYYGGVRSLNDVLWEVDNFIAVYDESYLTPCNVPIKSRSNVQQIGTASTPLPVELQTDEAIRYIDKAKELGLISDNGQWQKGLQMLACFARDMSIRLHLGKGERIAWQPFEKYFGIEKNKLRLNYNDIQKTGQTPTEVYLIDKVFE